MAEEKEEVSTEKSRRAKEDRADRVNRKETESKQQ